ncbi:uncharacterized protein [Apostichopus japonicus]|uniref:uncharacterized protein n=1 Tax=Stichopus japonicus TaxID=307972 RepID=UPI003AB85D7A
MRVFQLTRSIWKMETMKCLSVISLLLVFLVPVAESQDCNPPCNFGNCENNECICFPGYTGDQCQIVIDYCEENPCQNDGTCQGFIGGYACDCVDGWDGTNCTDDVRPCRDDPCLYGNCTEIYDTAQPFYLCQCFTGYTGDDCDQDIDECITLPCGPNGVCQDGINEYTCECTDGYTGSNCESEINECDDQPCKNGGTCQDLLNGFNCTCTIAWEGNTCESAKDPCASDTPCQNGGTCNNYYNSYTCTCPERFFGANCEIEGGICYLSGDSNFLTFDQVAYKFQGDCEYIFVRDGCSGSAQTLDIRVLTSTNDYGATYPVQINIYSSSGMLTLGSDLQVYLNGRNVKLPSRPLDNLVVQLSGLFVEVSYESADSSFLLKWDGQSNGEVRLSMDPFSGEVCGLCGNFNSNGTDEFIDPNGQLVEDVQDFGHSWRSTSTCPRKDPLVPCDESSTIANLSSIYCDIITQNPGPFSSCHNQLDPTTYFNACFLDGCQGNNDKLEERTCHLIELYAQSCRDIGATIDYWRNDTFCEITCPEGRTYKWCASGCSQNCADEVTGTELENCDENCVEGCECTEGLLEDGLECVEAAHCGCYENGIYYSVDDNLYSPGCLQEKVCSGYNNIESSPLNCDENAICGVNSEAVHGCYCSPGYDGDGKTCTDIDECLAEPCANGTCNNLINDFSCSCFEGWDGPICDEYIGCESDPCQNGGSCTQGGWYLICNCVFPYNGTFCEINNDPCADGNSVCQNGATCSSDGLEYNCTCAYGFTGKNCETEINPCSQDPCQNGGTCINQIDTYECQCGESFMGRNCEIEYGLCVASGDPHYKTYDGLWHDFQGNCRYILTQDCDESVFSIEVDNEKRSPTASVSFTSEVVVKTNTHEIRLSRNRLVRVNGLDTIVPYLKDGTSISVAGIYVQSSVKIRYPVLCSKVVLKINCSVLLNSKCTWTLVFGSDGMATIELK